jgi:hypothetical protein
MGIFEFQKDEGLKVGENSILRSVRFEVFTAVTMKNAAPIFRSFITCTYQIQLE